MKKKFLKQLRTPSNYIWIVIVAIFMSILAVSTSPLVGEATSDSGIFLKVGQDVANGKVLFKDIFDHKGPLLFFINSIPQSFIHGTLGVWIIETIFMSISVILIYKIGKLFFNRTVISILPPVIYMAFSIYTIQYGNVSEEYSNFFCIIAMYIFMNFYFKKEKVLSNLDGIILGSTFMAVTMIRINNAAIIVAITMFLFFYLLLKNNFKEAFRFVIFYIIGCLIILIPILNYFIYNNSVYDFLYGTFIFNIMYKGNSLIYNLNLLLFKTGSKFKIILWIIIAIYLLGILVSTFKKNYSLAIFLSLSTIITIIAICLSGHPFMHYLIIAGPQVALSIIIILDGTFSDKYVPNFVAIIIIIVISLWTVKFGLDRVKKITPTNNTYTEDAKDLASNITYDKSNLFGYNQEARWFFLTDTSPINRYFTLQDWWNKTDPNVYKELDAQLKSDSPTWVITSNPKTVANKDLSKMSDKFIMNYLKTNYTTVAKNNTGILYKLK